MSRRGLLLFLAAGVAWGLPYMFIRFADRDFSVPMIVFSRVLIGSIVLIPLALKRGALIPALKRWRVVLVFALLEMVGPWWLITSAENGHITSGLAGLLIATVPFFSIPIAFFYMGDKSVTHPKTLIGLVIGFLGVFVLVGIDAVTTNLDVGWVLLVILAAIGYSIAPAVAAKMAPEVHSSGIISLSMAVVALIYVGPALTQPLAPGVTTPSAMGWVSLAVLGVVCSAAAFVIFFALIKEIGSARATLITYLNTAFAIVLGIIFLAEPLTIGMAVGFPLVLVGSYFAGRKHA